MRLRLDLEGFVTASKKIIEAELPFTATVAVLRSDGLNVSYSVVDGDAAWDWLEGADMAGMLSHLGVDGQPALLLVAVDKLMPARVLVRHGSGVWEDIDIMDAPWLATSTAAAIREFLTTGERAPMKDAAQRDPRLFGSFLDEAPEPDDEGLI